MKTENFQRMLDSYFFPNGIDGIYKFLVLSYYTRSKQLIISFKGIKCSSLAFYNKSKLSIRQENCDVRFLPHKRARAHSDVNVFPNETRIEKKIVEGPKTW